MLDTGRNLKPGVRQPLWHPAGDNNNNNNKVYFRQDVHICIHKIQLKKKKYNTYNTIKAIRST